MMNSGGDQLENFRSFTGKESFPNRLAKRKDCQVEK